MRQCDKETYSVSQWQYCVISLFLQLHLKINCSHLHTYSDLYGQFIHHRQTFIIYVMYAWLYTASKNN